MTIFHDGDEWKRLARRHKQIEGRKNNWKCVDCGYKEKLHSGHILPSSRFPETRLWMSNLILQCPNCNYALGPRIRWCRQAIKLLVIVMVMRMGKGLIVILLGLYIYHDGMYNDWMATRSIQHDAQTVASLIIERFKPTTPL